MQPTIEIGQKAGSYTILSAEAAHGHKQWRAQCDACGKLVSMRTSKALSEPACPCTRTERAGRSPAAQQIDTSAFVSAQEHDDLVHRFEQLEDRLRVLEAKPAAPAPAVKTGGLKNQSLAPKRVRMTEEMVLATWQDLPPAGRLQKSILYAKILAEVPVKERTQELTWELEDRLTIERASIEQDPDLNNASRRRAFVDLIYDLDEETLAKG